MKGEMMDVRWQQRFDNYRRLLKILKTNFHGKKAEDFSELEQMGLGKSFELTFEILWKLLKDYLEYEEVEIGLISPKNILRVSAENGLLDLMKTDGSLLIEAHKSRNELTHIYDFEKFQAALIKIQNRYLPELLKVESFFGEKVQSHE